MKNVLLLSLLSLGVLTANVKANSTERTGVAAKQSVQRIETENLESTLYFDGKSTFKLGLVQNQAEKVKIQFISGSTCLFSASYSRQEISELFDISQFPEGNFKVRITCGEKEEEKEFFKSQPAATFE